MRKENHTNRGGGPRHLRALLRATCLFGILMAGGCIGTEAGSSSAARGLQGAAWPAWARAPIEQTDDALLVVGRSEGCAAETEALDKARDDAVRETARTIATYVREAVKEDWSQTVHGQKAEYEKRIDSACHVRAEAILKGAEPREEFAERTPHGWAAAVRLAVPLQRVRPDPMKALGALCEDVKAGLEEETQSHRPYVVGLAPFAIQERWTGLGRLLHDWVAHSLKKAFGDRGEVISETSKQEVLDAMAEGLTAFYDSDSVPEVGNMLAARALLKASVMVSATDVWLTVSVWDVETRRLLSGGTTNFARTPEIDLELDAASHTEGPRRAHDLDDRFATGDEIEQLIQKGDRHYDYYQDEEATDCYEQALKVGEALKLTSRVRALYRLGYLAAEAGDLDEGEQYCREALRLDDAHAKANANLGVILIRRKQSQAAEDYLKKAIRSDPELGTAHAALGTVYMNTERPDRAVEAFRKALECGILGRNAELHYNIGTIMMEQKKLPEAAQEFEKAVKARPDYANAWYNLGGCYLLLWQAEQDPPRKAALKAKAREAFQHFLELRADDPKAEQIRKLLEAMK